MPVLPAHTSSSCILPALKQAALVLCIAALCGGCRSDADAQAARLEPCPWWGCAGDNICLTETQTCVKPCARDAECPDGFLCKGYFGDETTFSGRGGRFCRPAGLAAGDACQAFGPACGENLTCVDGICRQTCANDDDCPPEERCHLTVLSSEGLSPAFSSRACVKATLPEGATCRPQDEPTCTRSSVCVFEKCRRFCTVNADCPAGQTCSGRGFSTWQGRLRMARGGTPDFLFCMP